MLDPFLQVLQCTEILSIQKYLGHIESIGAQSLVQLVDIGLVVGQIALIHFDAEIVEQRKCSLASLTGSSNYLKTRQVNHNTAMLDRLHFLKLHFILFISYYFTPKNSHIVCWQILNSPKLQTLF